MNVQVKRYYQLKQKQKEIEQELRELRNEIMTYMTEQGWTEQAFGTYKVKLVYQERKEYDDEKLYAALPDQEVWRMISKADSSKINSLIKLHVISEEAIKDTYSVKTISLLQIDKK